MMRVLLTGPVGSGKKTIANMLLKEFDQFGYFSAGEFIRSHVQRGTEFGQRASSFLNKGEHIPDSLLNGMLLSEVKRAQCSLILDGYPRSLHQVKMVEAETPLSLVVELKVPKKVLIDRLSKQLVHPASGRTYNLDFNPPRVPGVDDITGEPLEKRNDDVTEVVRRRLEVHDKTESKVADYYRKQGLCLSVPGETSPQAFRAISDAIKENMKELATGHG